MNNHERSAELTAFELTLIGASLFMFISILASKVAARAGVPALLLFLLIGMLAGSDGLGGIYFDEPQLVQAVGVVALIFILFSGGVSTRWDDIRPVLWSGVSLSTVGVIVTALAVGLFVSEVFNFTLAEGMLLGAIIASTDAAAVLSVLRGKSVRLKGRLRQLLELESGSNDPMAVFLTIGMIALITTPESRPIDLIPLFVLQMMIGAAIGALAGRLMVEAVNRLRLEYDGLYPVLTIAFVLLVYGLTAVINGNGFLAVYLAGLIMGNRKFIHKNSLLHFHDGVAWLMQIVMFLTLGLQLFPSRLPPVVPAGLMIALFLIFVARPLSVFISLAFSGFNVREKAFISWVGLRGAAPIILATFPLLAAVPQASTIFNLIFFIVLTSVLLQGTLIVPVARWLGVYSEAPELPRSPLAFVMDDGNIASDLFECNIAPDAWVVGRQIVDLNLPEDLLVVLIGREGDTIVPRGSTVLQAGDHIMLLAKKELQPEIVRIFSAQRPPADLFEHHE